MVQLFYETHLRPEEKQYAWWIERVRGQLGAAFAALDGELARAPLASGRDTITQAGVTTAVVWEFSRSKLPDVVAESAYPAIAAHGAAAEALAAFRAYPPD